MDDFMKTKLVLGIAACFFALATFNLFGDDFVKNGSFENSTQDGLSENWTPIYGGYQVSPAKEREGEKCIKIESASDKPAGALQKIKGFKPGGKLKFQSYVYIEEFTSGLIKPIHLSFISEGKPHYGYHININYSNEPVYELKKWVKYELELDLSKYPDVDEISFHLLTWPLGKEPFRGIVYFDRISVSEMIEGNAIKEKQDSVKK